MDKDFSLAHKDCMADTVIRRGYEIYDEWIDKKLDSRKVVASVYSAVKLFKKERTIAAFGEALAYLFALDARIKEKYHNILRCLISYFSWRRETRACNVLKTELNIPHGDTDVRDLIAMEMEKLVQRLEEGWDEDGNDETHGGKRNGKAEEEAVAEEKEAEDTEESPEAAELADKEETQKDSEEKEEMPIEEASQEDAKEEIGEKEETAEPLQEEAGITVDDKQEELGQKNREDQKEENNEPDVESEPSTDKKEKAKAYNDAMDLPPLYWEDELRGSAEKRSFIDEMVIDNMVKGDKSIIGYQRIDEAERNREAGIPRETAETQNEGNKGTDKDADLYDKMLAADKGDAQQTDKVEMTQETGKVEEEQPKETMQNNDNVHSTEQGLELSSEMLRPDNLNADPDNHIADMLNTNMSLESKVAYIRMQEDKMREQVSIVLEEFGMNDPVEIIGISEPDVVSPPSAMQNRK